MTEHQYIQLSKQIFDLILGEIDLLSKNNSNDLAMVYPKFIIMYEFFRMIRGEAFFNIRPPTPGFQKQLYAMEDEIKKRLETVKKKLDLKDQRVQFYLQEMAKNFSF